MDIFRFLALSAAIVGFGLYWAAFGWQWTSYAYGVSVLISLFIGAVLIFVGRALFPLLAKLRNIDRFPHE
jgi:hypothetical protein